VVEAVEMLQKLSGTDVMIRSIWEPHKNKVLMVVVGALIESEPHQSFVRASIAVDCEVQVAVLPFEGRLETSLSRDLVCWFDNA
jgi:hypothetical protein